MSGRCSDEIQSAGLDLNTADFVTLQELRGREFSFGVSQQDSVFSTDWRSQSFVQEAGLICKHAWINVRDVRDLRQSAFAFLEARRTAPFTTSACLFLPRADALPKGFLQGWSRILVKQKGESVCNSLVYESIKKMPAT
jgi:hypothetical protein